MSQINTIEAVYEEMCKVYGGRIFWISGQPTTISIAVDHGIPVVKTNNPKESLKKRMEKDVVSMFIKHLSENYYMHGRPYVRKVQSLYNSSGSLNPWYSKDWEKEMYKSETSYNIQTGEVLVRVPYPKIVEKNHEEFERLLQIILGDVYPTVKSWMAQMLFEDRIDKSGRATLVLYGQRGTGKSFFVDAILNKLLPGFTAPLPINWEQFNGFLENKLVFLDENESRDLNMRGVSVLAKKISGATTEMINKKFSETYRIKVGCYFCVMANKIPIWITELPTSEEENQFIVKKMTVQLGQDPEFQSFRKKHGSDLTTFIKNNVGSYIKEILLPEYHQIAQEYKDMRYGFPIPITSDLLQIHEVTVVGSVDIEMTNVMETMYVYEEGNMLEALRDRPDKNIMIDLWKEYRKTGFMANQLESFFASHRRVDLKRFRRKLEEMDIIQKKGVVKKINSKSFRGNQINELKFREFISEPEELKSEEIMEDMNDNF